MKLEVINGMNAHVNQEPNSSTNSERALDENSTAEGNSIKNGEAIVVDAQEAWEIGDGPIGM